MATKIGTATRNKQADSLGLTFYGGGTLKIYTGAQPATPDTAPSGTLLVTVALPATPWGAGSVGVASKVNSWSGVAVANGDLAGADTPGWFRIEKSGGGDPIDGVCGAVGSGAQLELAPQTIAIGQTVNIGSGTMTQLATP